MGVAVPLIAALTPLVTDLINRIPDPEAKARAAVDAQNQILTVVAASDAAQNAVNQVEAANPSVFVSGWRPAVGWVACIGLAVQTIGYPITGWVLSVYSPGTSLPQVDTETLLAILFPMLGIGAYRTIEKIKGVAK
jgi:hypothetical protein